MVGYTIHIYIYMIVCIKHVLYVRQTTGVFGEENFLAVRALVVSSIDWKRMVHYEAFVATPHVYWVSAIESLSACFGRVESFDYNSNDKCVSNVHNVLLFLIRSEYI